ncbi:uncharacterized protein [Diadema antillarum]|uniref:uncharacterized protein n=1 Tax=Diadema antillarum TaxID=105358 RepID=UPI003A8ACF4B
MTDSPSTIERLPLEHPLPEEIQQMTRDDTICKFCGVSYLIHHEVKRLEKELEKVNAQLEKYKACGEREKVLKVEQERLKEALSEKERIVNDRNASIEHLKSNVKVKEQEIWKAVQQAEAAQRQLEAEKGSNGKLRQWKKDVIQRLPLIMSSISEQKGGLASVRTELKDHGAVIDAMSRKLTTVIQKVCRKEKQVVEGIMSRATAAEKLSASLQAQVKEAEDKLAAGRMDGQMLGEVRVRLKEVEGRLNKATATEKRLEDELQKAIMDGRSAKSEVAQLQELLRTKSLEVEDVHKQRAKHEQFLSDTITKLQEELRCRVEEAKERQRTLQEMREREEEARKRIEASASSKMEATAKETTQLREALESARRDCSSLREERETMITTHQHRIEQLKESFRQRMQEADGWPEKLNEAMSKERQRHADEMASLEEKLRKSFEVELEIQKQRHDELILKYKQELESAEAKLKSSLQRDRESMRIKLEGVERELSETRELAAGQERALREEVESLKRVIAELNKHQAQEDRENEDELRTVKAELREAEQDLASAQQDKKDLERKLNQSKEEIAFLQETVHRECEERYELTEALSRAKEQLLVHHRGSEIANNSSGRESSHRFPSSPSSQVPMHPSSPKSNPPGGPSVGKRKNSSGNTPQSERTSSFTMTKSPVTRGGGGGGGGSLADSRHRIAAVLGRKELKMQIKTD